jgi:uncharacterized caspase-like protein
VRDKGMTDAMTTRDALSQTLEPRRVALLIGVDEYDDPVFGKLEHAGADATALGAVLAEGEGGGFDEVVVVTGPGTNRAGVTRSLRQLASSLRREDAVVVYFSGHGTRVWDGEDWRRFLLVSDSRAAHVDTTALDLRDIQDFFSSLSAVRKALIVDACFQGDGKSVVRSADRNVEGRQDPTAVPLAPSSVFMGGGEAHLYATSPGRPAREDDGLGHGVYTYYLLDALSWSFHTADLDQDGVITAWEAHDYARSRTMEHTGNDQVPEAAFRVIGEADLALAGDAKERSERTKAQIYLYGRRGPLTQAQVVVDGRDRGVFPGTVMVSPGRHHIVLRDADNRVLVDGYGKFSADRTYRADHLARVVQGPKTMLGARTTWLSIDGLGEAIGPGVGGIEGWLSKRSNRGRLHGGYGEISAGVGLSTARVMQGKIGLAPREAVWTSAALGYQADWRRLRGRVALGATTVILPPDDVADSDHSESEAGWWMYGAGPTVGASWTVFGATALGAHARSHMAWLDVDGDGAARVVPIVNLGVGLELAY